MSHIQLNNAFLFVCNVFWEIYWKVLFFGKKWLYQKEAQNYSEILFCSTIMKITKSRGKCGFCINNCFVQTSKKNKKNINNCFSSQNVPPRAKLYFSVILKYILVKSLKTSLFSQKRDITEEAQKYIKILFFSTSLKS